MYEQNDNTLKIQKLKHEQSLRDVWDMIRGEYALWDRQKVKTEKYRKNI